MRREENHQTVWWYAYHIPPPLDILQNPDHLVTFRNATFKDSKYTD